MPGGGEIQETKRSDAITYLQEVKDRFHDNAEVFKEFVSVMKDFKSERLDAEGVIQREKELFHGHPDLLLRFNNFLPKGSEISLSLEEEKGLSETEPVVEFKQAIAVINKIKARFEDDESRYQSFLGILYSYKKKTKSPTEVYNDVVELFRDHRDLVQDFTLFMPGFSAPPLAPPDHATSARGAKLHDESLPRKAHTSGPLEGKQEGDDLDVEDVIDSISELDPSKCERCTPSYVSLPKNYAKPIASWRSKSDAQVLNDDWVCVTSGSEDQPFKLRYRNKYEEAVFHCDDHRVEMDVLLEVLKATTPRAESLWEKIKEEKLADESIRLEDHFTALNLRCIERLYDEQGLELMSYLRTKPSALLPSLLRSLKRKTDELKQYHSHLKATTWDDVNKNYVPKYQVVPVHKNEQQDRPRMS